MSLKGMLFVLLISCSVQAVTANTTETIAATAEPVLRNARARQKAELEKMKSPYEFWTKEAERLKNYPQKSHLHAEAVAKANDFCEKAKQIASDEYLVQMIELERKDPTPDPVDIEKARANRAMAREMRAQAEVRNVVADVYGQDSITNQKATAAMQKYQHQQMVTSSRDSYYHKGVCRMFQPDPRTRYPQKVDWEIAHRGKQPCVTCFGIDAGYLSKIP